MRHYISLIAVAVIGASLFAACQQDAPTNITGRTNAPAAAATPPPADPAESAPRISLADAKKDFDAGTAVFVDTRAEVQYRAEHVKGAINIPAETMETRWKDVPTGKKIIAYCS